MNATVGRAEGDAGPVQSHCQVLWDTVTAASTSSPDGLQNLCANLSSRSVVSPRGAHQGFSGTKVPPPLLPNYYFHNIEALHHCLELRVSSGEMQRFGTKGRRKERHGRRDAAHITPCIPGRGDILVYITRGTGSQPKTHTFPLSSSQAPFLPMFSILCLPHKIPSGLPQHQPWAELGQPSESHIRISRPVQTNVNSAGWYFPHQV